MRRTRRQTRLSKLQQQQQQQQQQQPTNSHVALAPTAALRAPSVAAAAAAKRESGAPLPMPTTRASAAAVKREPAVVTPVTASKAASKAAAPVAAKSDPAKPAPKTTATATAAAAANGADEMTEYERKRLENIQRNLDFMKAMGVSTAKAAARTAIGGVAVKGHLAAKKVQPKRKSSELAVPTRKSRRIQGQQSDLVALGEQLRSVVQQEAIAARDEPRGRFDPTLPADALNLSSDQSASLLASITGGGVDDDDERSLRVDASGVDTVDYALRSSDIVKATDKRIYSVAFHPRADKVVVATGDKRGHIALWNADAPDDAEDVVAMYRPHTSPVTQLHFAPDDAATLLSASFDGSVRSFDLRAGVFTEVFASRNSAGLTSMAVTVDDARVVLVSCDDGRVYSVDTREREAKQPSYQLHESKINTVHQHPTVPFCIATASLDRTVCLWDVRKLRKTTANTPLVTMPHHRSVNCAYFSPRGDHLVTVGLDDYLHVFDTRDAKHDDAQKVAPTLKIPHNNQTGRWITKFHAAWNPKRLDEFVIGCMQQPRRLQLFRATRKHPIQELTSDFFNSVHSINAFHPTLDVIAGGNSSGRLALWRPRSESDAVEDDE